MTRLPGAAAATLRRLLALARDLLQAPDPQSVLRLAGPAIQELLAADCALLLLSLGDREYVTEFDRNGRIQPAREGSVLHRHARRAIVDQTPILLPEVAADPDAVPDEASVHRTASLLAIPFPPIEPICVLAASWNNTGRSRHLAGQISVLRYIGELTGAALGNIGLRQVLEDRVAARTEEIAEAARQHAQELHRRDNVEEELHRVSVTDVMTGLLNRRGFLMHAERSLKLARRQGLPSALIYADLDDVKSVNDQLGHDVGDRLIQDGARILRDSFRDSDVVGRLGGDEFAAFTIDVARPEVILARVRATTEAMLQRERLPYRISFSAGIVSCDPLSGLTLSDYLSIADSRMYEQKREQRQHGVDD